MRKRGLLSLQQLSSTSQLGSSRMAANSGIEQQDDGFLTEQKKVRK